MLTLRHRFHLLLGVAGLAASLSASAAGSTSLTFWHSRLADDAVQKIVKGFNKQSGVNVTVNWVPLADFKSSLLRSASEGEYPDVALVPSDFLSMDKELKFSRIPAHAQAKDILPNAAHAGLYEGRTLGAPVTWGSHLMLYYNRALVKTPAATFADLERQAAALKAGNVRALGMNFGEMYWVVPFLGAFGGWPVNPKGEITLNTPEMVQTLDFYFGLARKGLTPKDCRADCVMDRFAKGEFAYAIGGDWAFRDLSERMGERLGATLLPRIDRRTLTPMFSSYVLVFPNDALAGPKRDALLRFLRYMQSADVQRRWAGEAGLLPVNDKVFREVKAKAGGNAKASLEQLHQSRAMPNDRAMAFAWEGMSRGFAALFNGRADARQAAALMQSHAEKVARRAGP